MIEPFLSDGAFLADVDAARQNSGPRDLHIWWLGQSGFLLLHAGTFVLLDPYLSDSLTAKYAATDKPHVRMTRRVVDPQRLDFVSVVTSSHNHTDHLDAETLLPLIATNPDLRLVVPEANRKAGAERLGLHPSRPVAVNAGQTVTVGDVRFTGFPAAHETIERDEAGRCKFLGYAVKMGPWTVYHSGDTVRYDGMDDLLRRHGTIDVALLPINGASPERRVAGNLSGAEAAQLAFDIGAGMVIPCHYDMFEFNTASPDEFQAECLRLGQPHKILRAGERWSGTKA